MIFTSDKEIIQNIKVENAVEEITNADYGVHYLIIYSDLVTLREFYSYYIQKQIEERNDLVQIASFYESQDSVRQTLCDGHRAIDVKTLEQEKSLMVVDSLKKYFADDKNIRSDWNANKKMVDLAKTMGKNGYDILGDVGAFFYEGRMNDLIDYEMYLPTQYDINMKGICLYHQSDFDRLKKESQKRLAKHHGKAIKLEQH
ncbi:MAG TPA: hypothetical protein VJR94_01975 [Candidatus Nitrosocosmicus sp.]|nr:hypothetical protein [Candidatus Nitrosocosmicus sp.]